MFFKYKSILLCLARGGLRRWRCGLSCAAIARPGASLPVRRFARRLCCEAGLPVGSGRGLCVGRGGSCAAVACLAGAFAAGAFAAGASAAVGLAGSFAVVACLAGAGVACAGRGLCAARSGVRCLAWAVLPGCGLPGANNNPTNIAKNQCRANINHNILSPQHAILPHSSQKVCRGSLPE